MKKVIISHIVLNFSLLFSQYKGSEYHFESNKVKLDKTFSNERIKIPDNASYSNSVLEIKYDESNSLYCKSNVNMLYGPEADLSKIATLRWIRTVCYDKKGLMVLKYQRFLSNPNKQVEEIYFRNKSNKIIQSENVGDVLFQSTTDEILKVLEEVNINPVSIYERDRYSEINSRLNKIMTPAGQFWEFYNKAMDVRVLIDDKTKKVIAKTYDTSPKVTSRILYFEYTLKINKVLSPDSIKSIHTKEEIWDILLKIYPTADKWSADLITKGIWRVKMGTNENPMQLFVSDVTGEILVNSENFSKDYLGEQAFIKAVNTVLKNEN